MKILIVGTRIPTKNLTKSIGGAGIATMKIAKTLARREKVYVIPWWSDPPTLFGKNIIIDNVEYIRRRISPELITAMFKVFLSGFFRTTMKYTRGLNKIKYILLYAFDRAHIESIIKRIDPDIIHVHGLTLKYLPYIDVAIDKEIPLICTLHGLYSMDPNIKVDFDKSFEKDILMKLSNTKCTLITTVSTSVKEKCADNFHIPSDKIIAVPNGVEYEKFAHTKKSKTELRRQYSLPQEKIIILQVSSLTKIKNHITVLKALANMDSETKNKLIYLIVGDGPERKNLENFVKENGLEDNVIFMGYIPHTDEKLLDMYHLSDFFILPSTSEGFPLVLLEAMAAGLPIITFKDLGGVSDIYNSEYMELIPERDIESMVVTIKRAINKKWDRKKIMKLSKKWSWDFITRKYYCLYRKLHKKCSKGRLN